jgi:DNA polymerase bacteriophage-type
VNSVALDVLKLRQQVAKTSVKKLDAILSRTEGGVVRYAYKYFGARTGRWSAQGVQLHNLKRSDLKGDSYARAVEAIRHLDEAQVRSFGSVLDVVSSTIRGAFRAPVGSHLVVCDLSAIENRILGWLSGCQPIMDVFNRGLDPYIEFATKLYGKRYDQVAKDERQMAKPAVLGCGYQLSGGEWTSDAYNRYCIGRSWNDRVSFDVWCQGRTVEQIGDVFKSGLWGYAENMGVQMERDQAHEAVRVFRDSYTEVTNFWEDSRDAVRTAVINGAEVPLGKVSFGCVPDKLLWATLPSGRRLNYIRPRLSKGSVTTECMGDHANSWTRRSLYGGLITENLVQAIARDVLAEGMIRADDAGFTIVGHTHDEIIALEKDGSENDLTKLRQLMTEPMPWALDLPLAADGYEGVVYKK